MMANNAKPVTGGCFCGAVRYEASEPPTKASYCHCRMCQQLSGSAFVLGVTFAKATFRFTRGEPKFYPSSDIAERGFCANCGSRLIYRPFNAEWVAVKAGSLDHPEDFPPKYHTGVESQIAWLTIDDDLPRLRTEDNSGITALKAAVD